MNTKLINLLKGNTIMNDQTTSPVEAVENSAVPAESATIYSTVAKFNYNRVFEDHVDYSKNLAEFKEKGIKFSTGKEILVEAKEATETTPAVEEKSKAFIKQESQQLAVSFALPISGDAKILGGILETWVNHVLKRNDDIKTLVAIGELTEIVIDESTYNEMTKKAVKASATRVTADMVDDAIVYAFTEIETFAALAEAAEQGDKAKEAIRDLIIELLEGKCTMSRCKNSQLPRSLKEQIQTRLVECAANCKEEETKAVFELWDDNLSKYFAELDAAKAMQSIQL